MPTSPIPLLCFFLKDGKKMITLGLAYKQEGNALLKNGDHKESTKRRPITTDQQQPQGLLPPTLMESLGSLAFPGPSRSFNPKLSRGAPGAAGHASRHDSSHWGCSLSRCYIHVSFSVWYLPFELRLAEMFPSRYFAVRPVRN